MGINSRPRTVRGIKSPEPQRENRRLVSKNGGYPASLRASGRTQPVNVNSNWFAELSTKAPWLTLWRPPRASVCRAQRGPK
jgi:hypothetical protein